MKDYWVELFKDPGFMGALLGSILTSAVAVGVLFFQIRAQRELYLKDKYEEFYKYASILSLELELHLKKVDRQKIKQEGSSEYLTSLQGFSHEIEKIMNKIDSINESAILPDVYIRFETIKMVLSEIYIIYSEDLIRYTDEADMLSHRNGLLAYYKLLIESTNALDNKLNKVKKKLKIKE